jgi:hypothetical protein
MKMFLLLLFVAILGFSKPALSIELSEHKGGILISGKLVRDDYKKLVSYLRAGHLDSFANAVYLNSNGGDVIEAMRIANLVNKLYGNTNVIGGGSCFSACVAIWASGVLRTMPNDAKLGVHRVNLSREEMSVAKTEKAVRPVADGMESFLLKMGIPRKIIDKMNETSPTNLFVFDNRWLIQEDLLHAIGYLPTFIDVAQKKCGADPWVKASETLTKIDQQEALKWMICVDEVRYENIKIDVREWRDLIYAGTH